MKAVVWTHSAELQGAPMVALRTARALKEMGHTVTLLSPTSGPLLHRAKKEGIHTGIVRAAFSANVPTKRIERILDWYEPDYIVVCTIVGYKLVETCANYLPQVTVHWAICEAQKEEYERMLPGFSDAHYHRADLHTFDSEATMDLFTAIPTERKVLVRYVLPMGPERTEERAALKQKQRSALHLPEHATIVLCVGTLCTNKSQEQIIRAYAEAASNAEGQQCLVIVGKAGTRWHRALLHKTAKEEGLVVGKDIYFFPAREDVTPFYQAADVCVHGAYVESLGLVTLEAMAAGAAVIASDSYGIKSIITHEEDGLLVLPGLRGALTKALSTMLQHPEKRAQYAENAYKKAAHYTKQANLVHVLTKAMPEQSSTPRSRYPFFRILKKIWIACGKPFPGALRNIRHNILGKKWPAHAAVRQQQSSVQPVHRSVTKHNVPAHVHYSVVITSHNYGCYLEHAVRSVLAQSIAPSAIYIVSDASDDDTVEIAERYKRQYSCIHVIEGNWRNVGKARNEALKKIQSEEFIIFLDADDRLHPLYAEAGMQALLPCPDAAYAIPNHQFFGMESKLHVPPHPFNWKQFDRHCTINTAAMVRRTALVQAGGWGEEDEMHLDWHTARKVLALGWKTVKSDGIHFYRVHEKSMFKSYVALHSYAHRSGFDRCNATLFVSLSGRSWMWEETKAFLERQHFNHAKIHLFILDTAHDEAFSKQVRTWLATCDYAETTYMHRIVGRKDLPSLPRDAVRQELRDACATIYNIFARNCHTQLALFLEDDIIPPDDAYLHLASCMEADSVGVSAFYRHRESNLPVAWNWNNRKEPVAINHAGYGTARIGGTGFGCLVLRGERLRNTVFSSGLPYYNYDQNFFKQHVANEPPNYVLMDWSCICKHYRAPGSWA